jgi:hypothetical protein
VRRRELLTLAIGLGAGLIVGLSLHRRSAGDPQPAAGAPDRDTASEVRDLRAEVRALQRTVLARPAVPATTPAAPGADTPAARPPAPVPQPDPAAAEPTIAELEARTAADRVVDSARAAGAWTAADRMRLHQLASGMRPEDVAAVMKRLSVEINNQKVRLNPQEGPVF